MIFILGGSFLESKLNERVNIKIPKEWHRYVKYEALANDLSIQDMLVEMIRKYSETQENEYNE